jgi:hypothetical protein
MAAMAVFCLLACLQACSCVARGEPRASECVSSRVDAPAQPLSQGRAGGETLRLCGGAATASVPIGRQTQTVELQRWRAKLKEAAAISLHAFSHPGTRSRAPGAANKVQGAVRCLS